ncbi:MAG: hypothetical protein A3B34_03610 [Candidatus Sungbacteria bacterium RIFCSPLOWO2_01_FULL_54_21]|uniref:DUF8128 domain-containing protein n=1 Tax=Candidatus Sungbacteria bacterium RIFCSPLOWO2_01_FULL_54_21 TaxID=1802279 RepID=A0A1G2L5I2_9BACT|nr:MAG: hypothetical protein A3B34_03610 [Candidatus Sungbacteria bacterium RIFCSPLOWO2_01_FULL_54_21]
MPYIPFLYPLALPYPVQFSLDWFLAAWWLWVFLALLTFAFQMWQTYIQEYYKKVTNPWTMLEMHIPREFTQTPRAMEQVFVGIHALKNSASDLEESYWDGEVPLWFSFEAVSFGGEVHFYLFIPVVRKKHITSLFYAMYPDVAFTEVEEDYINRLPATARELYEKGYRMFGNELLFDREPVYPIKTYIDFEAPAEEKEVDTIGPLLETLVSIDPREHLWMQILFRPKVDAFITAFKKEGDDEISKIRETGRFVRGPDGKPILDPETGFPMYSIPSPGQVEAMKAIDRKVGKPAFDTVIRYMYVSPRDIFNNSFGRRSIFMAMNQASTESFNKFKHNVYAWTLAKIWYAPYIFPKHRAADRREWLYHKYRSRTMYPDMLLEALLKMKLFHWGFKPWKMMNVVLATDELATLFHPPTAAVLTGPLIKRTDARRVGPPATLPIYGETGEDENLPGIE